MLAERYQELWTRLHELREAWLELCITVREDRPGGETTMLIDRLCDEVDDGVAMLDEALRAVAGALEDPDDARAGGRALAAAHERLSRATDGYMQGLGSRESGRELHSLGRRRGGEWAGWAKSVDDAQARFPSGLTAISEALRRAWTELVDRAAAGSASLTAQSIGHQINVPGAQSAEARG